jgi:hypothetical protein
MFEECFISYLNLYKDMYKIILLKIVLSSKPRILVFFVFTHLAIINNLHKRILPATVMDSQQHKKTHKGWDIARIEPYDMKLLKSEPLFMESFQSVGCINFCQNM